MCDENQLNQEYKISKNMVNELTQKFLSIGFNFEDSLSNSIFKAYLNDDTVKLLKIKKELLFMLSDFDTLKYDEFLKIIKRIEK